MLAGGFTNNGGLSFTSSIVILTSALLELCLPRNVAVAMTVSW